MSRAPTFAAASVATAGSVGLGRFQARVVQCPGLASAARKCGKMRPVPHRPAQHRDDRAVGVTAGASEVVIATKLFRPNPRHQTVERTRLHDLLRQGCTLPLTLVVAPAGWGKSTLVADWLRQDRVAAGWVSLDDGDDDPKRFWRYLLLAAGQAMPAAGAAELRAEHLKFSLDEAREFFGDRLGKQLSEQDVHRLLARTEGWAAGLQLAALRLKDRADPSAFIERFTGADWHIVSYLGEEVLASQPPRVREFLLVTSVLNRMCAPLCNALTGRDDGADLIGEVNRANLFLIPLDDERRWFRYHHLFGGLLRHELARTAPRQPSALHQRAAQWYAANGDPAEAIGHAISSGDGSLTRGLVAAPWRQHFNAGQLETVRRWLDALPAEVVAMDASLSAALVWIALDTGRLEDVGAALDAAEASGPPDTQLTV